MVSKGFLKKTTTVSSMTLISRLMGFARDMVVAQMFGAAAGADAFFVAFKIPNLMRRLFAEGAFSQAFVPILSECREQHGHEYVKRLVSHVTGCLGLVLLLVVIIGVFCSPILITIFAPGFAHSGPRFDLASHMLKVTFPYLFLISMTACYGAILNTYDKFAIPALTPVLLNICMITAALLFAPYFSHAIYALAWGVFAAGVVQLIFQMPFVAQQKLLAAPKVDFKDPDVRRILKLMVPAIFGVSVAQINILIDTWFASFLPVGSVSWLYYADRLTQLPLGVFGVAIATVILPYLSRSVVNGSSADKYNTSEISKPNKFDVKTSHHKNVSSEFISEEDMEKSQILSRHRKSKNYNHDFGGVLNWGIKLLLLIGLPAAVGLFVLSGPLITSLFQYGAFNASSVVKSQHCLMAFAIGVQFFMLTKVLASGFYAHKNIKTPVKIGAFAMLANIVFNLMFIIPLQQAGIALATSLSGIINAGLLFYMLHKNNMFKMKKGLYLFVVKLLVANIVMGMLLYFAQGDLSNWLQADWAWRFGHILLLVSSGGLIYAIVLLLLGIRPRNFKSQAP